MTSIAAIGLSGMNAALQQADDAARRVASPSPGVDDTLAEDLVQTVSATYAFKANLKVVQVGDDLMGSLLDAFA